MARRVLVTGSEGSLAQMIIPILSAQGHDVLGVDRVPARADQSAKYDFVQADLADTAAVRALYNGHDVGAIIHCAALVYGVGGFHQRPADIIADNNLITINLLKYGHESIERFVYISSSMVYESSRTYPHREADTDSIPVMRTAYGLSKYIGERVVQAYHQQYGTAYVIWRPFNIITPFEEAGEEGFSHVFSDLIEKILVQRLDPVPILGDGQQIRCFTNIWDVADAIGRFSMDERATNQVFNLGNPEPVSVVELAARIVRIGRSLGVLGHAGDLRFENRPAYPDDVRRRVPDVERAREVFGWQARTPVDTSLEQCIRHRFSLPDEES